MQFSIQIKPKINYQNNTLLPPWNDWPFEPYWLCWWESTPEINSWITFLLKLSADQREKCSQNITCTMTGAVPDSTEHPHFNVFSFNLAPK